MLRRASRDHGLAAAAAAAWLCAVHGLRPRRARLDRAVVAAAHDPRQRLVAQRQDPAFPAAFPELRQLGPPGQQALQLRQQLPRPQTPSLARACFEGSSGEQLIDLHVGR